MIISRDNGFTFIEVMVAILILGIGIGSLFAMQTTSIRGNATAIAITELSTRTAGFMEHIAGADYYDELLDDDDLDGTNQDRINNISQEFDPDGIDDDDNGDDVIDPEENFGLHHDTSDTADGNRVIDENTTIYWNIAVDVPTRNMKTIHVIVITKKFGRDKKVEFEYYKDDVI